MCDSSGVSCDSSARRVVLRVAMATSASVMGVGVAPVASLMMGSLAGVMGA
jgi:hypothetical protein